MSANAAEVAAMFDVVEKEFGGVDILVNNAGVMNLASIATTDDAMLDRTISINLKGTFNGLQCLPCLAQFFGVHLPYSDPDRLVVIWETKQQLKADRITVAAPNFEDWREQNHVFEGTLLSRLPYWCLKESSVSSPLSSSIRSRFRCPLQYGWQSNAPHGNQRSATLQFDSFGLADGR